MMKKKQKKNKERMNSRVNGQVTRVVSGASLQWKRLSTFKVKEYKIFKINSFVMNFYIYFLYML